MGLKASLVVLSLLLALALASASASAKQDPELKQCRHQCKVQQQFSEEQQRQCEQRCEDYYLQKQERKREEGREEEKGGGDDRKQLKECQKQCERRQQKGRSREGCQQRCVEAYGRKGEDQPRKRRGKEDQEKERGKEWVNDRYEEEEEEEGGESEGREESDNPYVFDREHFKAIVETEHGRVSVLPKFTKRSKLLRGIENFRLALLEAEPNTFEVPSHWDTDAVLFIVEGRGTITLVRQNKRHSINIEEGDIVRVEAGTPVYMINRDQNQKLIIAELLRPVNLPGQFEAFYGTGGQNPESFYTAFSWEVLEAALKTDRNKLERLFGQQQQGAIVKASREQIEALSGHEEGGRWPFGGGESHGSKGSRSFNLFNKHPSHANQHGQLYIADRDDFKELEDMDVMISFANITQGSMIGPYYNSRATKISFVTEGEGYLEMACPHLSSSRSKHSRHHQQQGGGGGQTYQKVRAQLRRGTAFIVPAGHPVAAIASKNSNLQIACFEVNAENNVRYPLAGKRNIIDLMEREAKELAFNFPSRDVDRIFKSQDEEFFFAGPEEWQEQERGYADE
ncbi:hypothetical protein ACJRO7_017984 [Eucalyptus globulus]|uniref:Cupin type-1 domain-containing protein n=1 Tax=Eucalyptus globulus TaxID=34317 RepID=A0ABD3KYD8_EUCGL